MATAPKANDRRAAMPKREARGSRGSEARQARATAAAGRSSGGSFFIVDEVARDPDEADVVLHSSPRNVCGCPKRARPGGGAAAWRANCDAGLGSLAGPGLQRAEETLTSTSCST